MSTTDNKTHWRRFVVDVLNQGNIDALGDFVAPTLVWHTPAPGFTGDYEGFEGYLMHLLEAFPDMQYLVEELLAEGQTVASRATWTATHRAAFLHIAPTGRTVRVVGVDLARLADGRIVELWTNFDAWGLMAQLDALPPPGKDLRLN
jgi:predicted ester cyclase